MNKIKRSIAVLAAAVMTAAFAGTRAFAADDEFLYSNEDSRYKYIVEKVAADDYDAIVAVSQYSKKGFSGVLSIPSTIDELTVGGIYDSGFSGSEITNLTIPESVTKIGSLAFSNCLTLVDASIPSGITSMGTTVFSQTPYETALIKNSESTGFAVINDYILYLYTGSASEITVPEGISVIAGSAFANNGVNSKNKIKSVKMPTSTEYICSNAFDNCTGLQKVVMGKNIKNIEPNVFSKTFRGIIYGYEGTAAADYAKANGLKFVEFIDNGNIIGDANTDDYVNVMDAALIANYLANGKRALLPQQSDFNKDNQINVMDAASIAKFLATGKR